MSLYPPDLPEGHTIEVSQGATTLSCGGCGTQGTANFAYSPLPVVAGLEVVDTSSRARVGSLELPVGWRALPGRILCPTCR